MKPVFWLIASIIALVIALAAFIYLFVLDFNIYYFILSPIILALYVSPAVYLFSLWKKAKQKTKEAPPPNDSLH